MTSSGSIGGSRYCFFSYRNDFVGIKCSRAVAYMDMNMPAFIAPRQPAKTSPEPNFICFRTIMHHRPE